MVLLINIKEPLIKSIKIKLTKIIGLDQKLLLKIEI